MRGTPCSPPVTACHPTWAHRSRVLALWAYRANFCDVLTVGNALLVPTFLDFRGTEQWPPLQVLSVQVKTPLPSQQATHYSESRPPVEAKGPDLGLDCFWACPEQPVLAQKSGRGLQKKEEEQLGTCSMQKRFSNGA